MELWKLKIKREAYLLLHYDVLHHTLIVWELKILIVAVLQEEPEFTLAEYNISAAELKVVAFV